MKVMAILNIIGAISTIIQGAVAVAKNPGNGVMFFVLSILPLVVSWQWFQWLKEDLPETTANLVKWMRLQFFVNSTLQIIVGILIMMGVFNHCEDITQEECDKIFAEHRNLIIFPVILQVTISILIMFYFYNVTRRYQAAFHSESANRA
jgi:hypothetical protein